MTSERARPEKVRIREMEAGDKASVAALSGQLGYPATPSEIERRFAALRADQHHKVYVAESAGAGIVGWLHLYACNLMMDDRRVEIWGLVVDEACRGRGIGRCLMKQAEAWAEARGCRTVALRSNIVRETTHVFYEKLGYRRMKTQHVFAKSVTGVQR
jgi:GNAT superfamily N-acetyltransferase